MEKTEKTKKPFRVFLDPGHGGRVFGQIQTAGKRSPVDAQGVVHYEGELNRRIAYKAILEHRAPSEWDGRIQLDTWTTNFDLSPITRAKMLNNLTRDGLVDLIVSIHCNAAGDGALFQDTHFGPRFFVGQSARTFAWESMRVFKSLFRDVPTSRVQIKENEFTLARRIDILDSTIAPSVLIECNFMDHKSALFHLVNSSQDYASEILAGIQEIAKHNGY